MAFPITPIFRDHNGSPRSTRKSSTLRTVAWLASIRQQEQGKSVETDELARLTVPDVRQRFSIALPLPMHSPELHLAWSMFRRKKQLWARRSHY